MKFFVGLLLCASLAFGQDEKPLRVAIAGLAHGHVDGFFRALQRRKDVEIVGVFDPDVSLHKKYQDKYHFDGALFFTSLGAMLDKVKPEAVATFTNTFDHPVVVEACSARKIPVMMEKPLAVSMEHASVIQKAAARQRHPGDRELRNHLVSQPRGDAQPDQGAEGDGRNSKDGRHGRHQGPQRDPRWARVFRLAQRSGEERRRRVVRFRLLRREPDDLDDGQPASLAVTAMTQQIKPEIYAHVDDEATVLVEYPKAQGIIRAPGTGLFRARISMSMRRAATPIADGGDVLKVRLPGRQEESRTPPEIAPDERDSVSYLIAVVRGRRKPCGAFVAGE